MTGDGDPTIQTLRRLSDDTGLFESIINLRRRTMIRYMGLLPPDAVVETSELARVCAAVERDLPLHKVNHQTYRQAYQSVQSRDIPKLVDANILDKHDRDTITRGNGFSTHIKLLDAMDACLDGEQN